MLKPLYLNGREKTEVALDGPALRIARPARADVRLPFRRISRIVVSGGVNWDTKALLACADNNVPIVFLRGNGSVRARWLGAQSRHTDLQQKWSYFIDRPDWQDLYEDWRVPARRRALALSATRLGFRPNSSESHLNRLVLNPIRALLGETIWSRIRKRLEGLIETETIACLTQSGFQWSDTASATLVADLCKIVAIGLLPELKTAFDDEPAPLLQSGSDKAIVEFIECHRGTVEFNLRLGLQSFYRFLEGLD